MTRVDITATLQEIEKRPMAAQMDLVQQLWDRIVDSDWQPQVSEEQKAELDRRLAALDENPQDVVSWESIVKHVRRAR